MASTDTMSLTKIQNWMQSMLIQHLPISDPEVALSEMINDSQRLNAQQHLFIYRQSYSARLRACMKNQFKALAYALGDVLFEAFADHYLDHNPSSSYTLNDLGEKFPAFLEENRPDVAQIEKEDWPDFMIQLSEFEYRLSVVFDLHEAQHSLPDENTNDALLTVAASLRLFQHRFPICRYYLDFNADLAPELPFPEESYCAVSRQNYKLGLFTLGKDHYYFLKFLTESGCIEDAKNELIDTFHFDRDSFENVWPIWRKNFIASGFLVCRGA